MAGMTRRNWLMAGAAAAAGGASSAARAETPAAPSAPSPTATGAPAAAPATPAAPAAKSAKPRWSLCLNSSTIRPARPEEKIRAAAEAGFDGIELWLNDLDAYEKSGGSVEDLGRRARDSGLALPNVIGIFGAMPPADDDKAKAMDGIRRSMERAARLGAKHIAAVASPDRPDIDLLWAAGRYRELIDIGRNLGVTVAIEFLGFAKGVHTLGQAALIAMEADRPEACIVADTFHMYRGGSAFGGVRLMRPEAYAIWHVNDAPAQPGQFELRDGDRVLPGDGVLPLVALIKDLAAIGFTGPLSLEVFMRDLWQQPPADAAKRGIDKMRAVLAAAGVA
jgi:sugar phosphate isomerase/epimerase